ncbi:hypothetical protein [Sorangium sp. So ce1182]
MTYDSPWSMTAAYLNGDGRPDLAIAANSAIVLINACLP